MSKKQDFIFKKFIFFIFTLIELLNAFEQQNNISFVYSQINVTSFEINDKLSAYTSIKVAKKANLVFVSAGMEGILIIDAQNNDLILRQSLNQYINSLDVTSDGNYVFVNFNSSLTVFSFESRTSLQALIQSSFPTNITDITIDNQEARVYAVGLGGVVVAYDIQNKKYIKQVGIFQSYSVTAVSAFVSPDDNWLFVASGLDGLLFLRIVVNQLQNIPIDDKNINYELKFDWVAQGFSSQKTVDVVITESMDYIYCVDNWFGIFFYQFSNLITSSSTSNSNPQKFQMINFWPYKNTNPSTYCLALIQNSNYLAVGVRSQGVFIFDISNKMNPILYQKIPVQQNSLFVAVSRDEKYLYFSNGNSLRVFQKIKPNLNLNFPNLFNMQQSIFLQTSTAYYKWRCYVKQIDGQNYFFGAFDSEGFYILNVTNPYDFKTIYQKKFENQWVDSLVFAKNQKYLFVPVQESNTSIIVYDISVLAEPKEVTRFKVDQSYPNEVIFISKDEKLIAMTFGDGIMLLSFGEEVLLLDHWRKFNYMIGESSGVMITNDNKFLIGCIRGYGYYVLSIHLEKEKNVLSWEYTLQTLGGEGIVPSKYYGNYAYIYDGYRGVGVLDTTALPDIKIISRIQLQGWSNYIVPMLNDDYLLVAQIEAGMVSLIDSRNKTNLILISQLQYQSQTAQSLCITEDYNYIFVNNNLGTLVMPLQSQVTIHTQFLELVTDSNGLTFQKLVNNNYFQIGQIIKMKFLILYPQEGAKIMGFQYYQNELIYDTPRWISFDIIDQQITLNIDKQALGDLHQNNNVNIILLRIVLPIYPTSFIFSLEDGSSTTEQDSFTIFTILKQLSLITSDNYVSQTYDYTLDFTIILNGVLLSQNLQKAIRLQLQNSIFINQIQFFASSSLEVNLIEDTIQPIQSLSQYIEIIFQVALGKGKFILNNYEGVIASFSQAQEQLHVQGPLISINKFLFSKIIFFSNQDLDSIDVTIFVSDSLNYPVTQIVRASKCKALKKKIQTIKNKKINLQKQFNSKYSDGVIKIQELFQIDFSSDSFINEDTNSINYNGYIVSGETQTQIQFSTWIQFKVNNGQISIQGTPSSSLLYEYIKIRIVADDGYTQATDEFLIKINGIPFVIVLNLLIQILGPLLAIIKIYTYRFKILNMFYKNKVSFSKETILCGQVYCKRFIIMGDNMIKCINLFKGFVVQYNKIKSKSMINKSHSCVNCYSESLDFSITKSSRFKEALKEQNQSKTSKLQVSKSLIKQDKLLLKIQNLINEEMNRNKPQSRVFQIQEGKIEMQVSKIDNTFVDAIDGDIKMKSIITQIKESKQQFNISGKSYSIQSFELDFKNKNSFIYKGIEALSARFFLKRDNLSHFVYQFLKKYSLKNSLLNINDWYQYYVNIKYTDKKDCFGQQIPFPILNLKTKVVDLILQQIQQNLSCSSAKQYGININLIQSVLYADTLGLVDYIPKILSPCIGESIHLHSYQINGIQTYKEIVDGRFLKLKQLLKINYNQYGTSKNRSLPSWLDMEHKSNTIDLIGMPMSQDIEDIQIRVTDSNNFVIKQFTLSIKQDESQVQSQNTFDLETQSNRLDIPNQSKLEQIDTITRNQSRSLTKKKTKSERISFLRSQQNIQYLTDKVISEENCKQTIDEIAQENILISGTREAKKSIFCYDKNSNQKSLDSQDMIVFSSQKLNQKIFLKNELYTPTDKFSTLATQISPQRPKQVQVIQLHKMENQLVSSCSIEDKDMLSNEDFNKNDIFKSNYFSGKDLFKNSSVNKTNLSLDPK